MRAPQDKREKERNDHGPLDYNCWNQARIYEDPRRERADTNAQRHELQSPEKHLVAAHLDAQRPRSAARVFERPLERVVSGNSRLIME